MENMLVLLDRNDMEVTLDGNTLKVRRPGVKPRSIPLGLIGQVIVYGRPLVACDVWRALAERNIPAVLLPGRGKGGPAWLGGGLSTAVMVRTAQHRERNNPETIASVCRWLLSRKVGAHQKIVAAFYEQARNQKTLNLFGSVLSAKNICQKAESALKTLKNQQQALTRAKDADRMRGHEGAAAAAWYDFLAGVLPDVWKFSGRNRMPPLDPLNSLLSLSYTIVGAEVGGAVLQRGLDPGVGFLHTLQPGRESLTLDMVEPLRPCADVLALSLLGTALKPEHFTISKQEGCRLTADGRNLYYGCYAQWRHAWPVELIADNVAEIDELGRESEAPAESTNDGYPTPSSPLIFQQSRSLSSCCRWIVNQVVGVWQTSNK